MLPEPEPVAGAKPGATPSLAEGRIALHLGWSHQGRAADDLIRKCVGWTWRVKLSLSTERDLFARLREDAVRLQAAARESGATSSARRKLVAGIQARNSSRFLASEMARSIR